MQLPNDPDIQAGLATRRAVLGKEYVDAALNNVSDFTVTGNPGGPFTIVYNGELAGVNVDELIPVDNGLTPTNAGMSTITQGNPPQPTQAQAQTAINSILTNTGIAGATATVIGPAGGPFMVAFNGTLAGYNLPLLQSFVTLMHGASVTMQTLVALALTCVPQMLRPVAVTTSVKLPHVALNTGAL